MRCSHLAFSLILLLSACGGGGGGSSNSNSLPSSYMATTGVAQKGPLIKGSTVTAQELSAQLAPTGKQYSFQVTSNFGTFTPNATFGSPYIGLTATGYYYDEVQGGVSGGTITLNGYADLSSSQTLNVNLLTTLAYQRIANLVTKNGMSVAAATTQAENEVLAALNIPNGAVYGNFATLDLSQNSNGDQILAAISSLFVYGNSSGQLAQLIANFQSDIADNGVIDSAQTKSTLALAAQQLNAATVASNLSQEYAGQGISFSATGISNWINASGDGVVGAFRFTPAAGTATNTVTLPTLVTSAVAGTTVTVSTGQLLVNGSAVSSAIIAAGDTIAISVPAVQSYAPTSETVYLLSNGTRVAEATLTPQSTPTSPTSLLAGSWGGEGNLNGTGSSALFDLPESSAVDSSGNVYVADTFNNVIRKITPAGVVSTFAGTSYTSSYNSYTGTPCQGTDGTGTSARFCTPLGLAIDTSNNLYVADNGNHTIRMITSAGVVSTVAGTAGQSGTTDGQGSAARFSSPTALTVGSNGTVYVADGGALREISSSQAVTTLHLSGSANCSAQGLAVDASGTLYLAAETLVCKVSPAGATSVLAGNGTAAVSDGTGTGASFYAANSIALDSAGNLFVTDDDTIRQITTGGKVTTLAGMAGATGSADGSGTAARFQYPTGISVSSSGTETLYVADSGNHTIRAISLSGNVTTLAGLAAQRGKANGTGAGASFSGINGVVTDSAGNTYVAELGNCDIRKITTTGSTSTYAGIPGSCTIADGPIATATFQWPQALTVDGSGNVYVIDNETIRKITPGGMVSTLAGTAGQTGSSDGQGSGALFKDPTALATDSAGNIYVTDEHNYTIRKVTPGGLVSTFAGTAGQAGTVDGQGSNARFGYYQQTTNNGYTSVGPYGIAVDGSGNVYVADTPNNTIRKITPNGTVSTIAGSPGYAGWTDGTGAAARFNNPLGLTVDTAGNVFVADNDNGTIREVTQAGVVTTVVGSPFIYGNPPGGSPTSIGSPYGVAITPSGQLVIANQYAVLISAQNF